MPLVKILRPGFVRDRKAPKVGDVVEVSDSDARAMFAFNLAEPVKAENPADDRETATDPNADDRETRDDAPEDDADGEDAPAEPTAKAVRTWAKDNGLEVPSRGAIPADVREAFNKAHESK